MTDSNEFFARLDEIVDAGWARIKRGAFARHVAEHGVSPELYRRTMIEVFHYTRHNSINQAVAAYRVAPERTKLLGFCYRHAGEELGHERMVVRDLEAAGLLDPSLLTAPPLPPTQALIGYLYYVALDRGAVPRLGYSYWAESAYGHIGSMLSRARQDLKLTDRKMTFFVSHSDIDEKHAADVRDVIRENVRTEEERSAVIEVARTTLYMTGVMLEAIHETVIGGSK